MRKEQKVVLAGALSGILAMLVALGVLSPIMPDLPAGADEGARLAFAVKWTAFAAAPLFAMLAAIGNARFASDAIDPTAHKESPAMVVDGRVADNTLQQYVLFAAAALAVAAVSRSDQLGLVAAAAIIFTVCRFAFWIGYRIDPLYRAFGFSSTAYLNLVLFGVAAWRAWS
jgi:hypothetical protein